MAAYEHINEYQGQPFVNRRTGETMTGLTPKMAERWEHNTRTLLPEGVAGPMLPEDAGYHDAAVRMSNAWNGDIGTPGQTYVGPTSNEDYHSLDIMSTKNVSYGLSHDLAEEGDPRVGGRIVDRSNSNVVSTSQDPHAFRKYIEGTEYPRAEQQRTLSRNNLERRVQQDVPHKKSLAEFDAEDKEFWGDLGE